MSYSYFLNIMNEFDLSDEFARKYSTINIVELVEGPRIAVLKVQNFYFLDAVEFLIKSYINFYIDYEQFPQHQQQILKDFIIKLRQ